MTCLQASAPSPGTDAAKPGGWRSRNESGNCFKWQEHVGCSYYSEHLKTYDEKAIKGVYVIGAKYNKSTLVSHDNPSRLLTAAVRINDVRIKVFQRRKYLFTRLKAELKCSQTSSCSTWLYLREKKQFLSPAQVPFYTYSLWELRYELQPFFLSLSDVFKKVC